MNDFLSRLINRSMEGVSTIRPLIQPSSAVDVPLTNEPLLDTYQPDVFNEATESISTSPSPGEASLRPYQPGSSDSQRMDAMESSTTSSPSDSGSEEEPVSTEPVPSPAKGHATESRIQRKKVISVKGPIADKTDVEGESLKSRPTFPVTDLSDSGQSSETYDMITSRLVPPKSTKGRAEPIRNIVPPMYKESFGTSEGQDSSTYGIDNAAKAHVTRNMPSGYIPDDNISEAATPSTINEAYNSISRKVLPASTMLGIETSAYQRLESMLPQRAERKLSVFVSPPPPPSIQVTIGRIEVRALPPQSPPVPHTTPRRRETILSLDEYLKGRNERQK